MSPCNVPVQRARARHCAGFLCHCPTPCPRTMSLCTLPLQPPMRPCVTPTWLSLCPQGGVGDPGPEATVSLTAFVVVALHSTRVLLPPDSPDQQLLVCPHPLPMSACPLLVSSMSSCPLPVSSMPPCPLLVLWVSLCIPHVSPVVSPCLSLHPTGVPTLPGPQVPALGAIACPHTPIISPMSLMPQCPPSVPHVLMPPHISMFPICLYIPRCPPIPFVSPMPSMSPHVPVSSHPMSWCRRTRHCPRHPPSCGATWRRWGPLGQPSRPTRWHWWTPAPQGHNLLWSACVAWPARPTVSTRQGPYGVNPMPESLEVRGFRTTFFP